MTLQEAKDQIAQQHGYDKWDLKIYENGNVFMDHLFVMVAELYAREYAKHCMLEAINKFNENN